MKASPANLCLPLRSSAQYAAVVHGDWTGVQEELRAQDAVSEHRRLFVGLFGAPSEPGPGPGAEQPELLSKRRSAVASAEDAGAAQVPPEERTRTR